MIGQVIACRRRWGCALIALTLSAPVFAQAAAPAVGSAFAGSGQEGSRLLLPKVGLRAGDVAVIVNDADPASVEISRYYASQRGISADRLIHVRFPVGQSVLSRADFERAQAVIVALAGDGVQALALAWTLPYRVECMSITAAFALGFDPASYCAEGCQPTKASPYFNSPSSAPFTDHRLRPAMLLAGHDVESVKRLINRGLRSDERWPEGKAYLMNTGDAARNVRADTWPLVRQALGAAYPIEEVGGDALEGRTDVMFHFTGAAQVAAIASNRFIDGAIADNLTSLGGVLSGAGQTTALEWLAAGATGSYGTSSEPCNFRGKFPSVGVVMAHYLGGETLVEAYWKSVQMPGQGVFVGDPLARPFGGVRLVSSPSGLAVQTRALPAGNYIVQASRSRIGPFRSIGVFRATGYGVQRLKLPAAEVQFFRLVPGAQNP